MDNIQVDESPNTKINKKKKSKLSTDMTDAGPSENSIEHSDANIIKPKKSFWKSIFRFKSRKQEMPESVVADMRRNAMKAPNLDTIFEEQEDSDISDSDSKVTEKTNTSWIPLKDTDQASSKFESTTDEFLVDDSLSSEEEIPKEKIMLPEGNADKILKEIQAQLKKGKAKKLKDELKSDSDQTSTITKEDYSFEYSGSSGQSLDEEEKANRIIDQNKELVESLVNQLDTNSSKPESIELSQHASKEVVAKLSEKKVTFLPAPFEDLPDVVADATFEPTQMLSEDIMPSPNGSFGAEEQLDAKTTPEGPVATVVPIQQEEESTAATSDPGPHPSSLDPSAPSEDLYSLNSNKEKQVEQPSSQQQQFSATDMTADSGQSEDTGNQLTLPVLHQDMVSISGNSSIEHEGDKDAVATPQHPGHLQLERKTPEMDLPTVEKDMHHKIEEDLRSFQESINQIVDVNKKTISIINSSQISSPNDSISIVSSGGLIQTSSVEDPGPEKGNCHQTSVNKLDAPLLDSFQPRLNPTNISSSASSSSHLSFAQQDSEEQSSTQDDPLSEQGIDEASLMQLPADDFVVRARQIREQITAKLKKKKEEDILQKDTVVEIQKDENRASTSTTQMSEHSEDAADAFEMDEAVFKEMLQNEEIQVNLKKSRARRDLSSCCMLKVQNLDLENGEIQRTSKKTNLIDEMLVKEQQRSTELDAEELSTRLQSDTMAAFQQKNSCFYVGTQIDEICNEMGRLCLSADSEKVPVNNFNFGLRKSQIFKGELDKRVKVSFGECGSSSSADNAARASCCSKMCDNEENLTRTPIDKSIEE